LQQGCRANPLICCFVHQILEHGLCPR
jgi:hypothetical protein